MTQSLANPTAQVFALEQEINYRGATYREFKARHPKVRDLRVFLKEVDRDAILAMEKTLANLCEVDEPIIAEMGIKDFSVMKKWFEGFLKHMMNDSDD